MRDIKGYWTDHEDRYIYDLMVVPNKKSKLDRKGLDRMTIGWLARFKGPTKC